ncbi:MAG: hypothetical protein V7K97_26315 [Nostoc sp.]
MNKCLVAPRLLTRYRLFGKQNLPTLRIGVLPTQSRTEQERMIKPHSSRA